MRRGSAIRNIQRASPKTAAAFLRKASTNILLPSGSSELDCKMLFYTLKGILKDIERNFQKPMVIDKRRAEHFIKYTMPSAPPLTLEDEKIFHRVDWLEEDLRSKGKRVWGTLQEDVDKFLWRDNGKIMGGFRLTVDCSAELLLANLFNINSYDQAREHQVR
jgi:hypothetical protein